MIMEHNYTKRTIEIICIQLVRDNFNFMSHFTPSTYFLDLNRQISQVSLYYIHIVYEYHKNTKFSILTDL